MCSTPKLFSEKALVKKLPVTQHPSLKFLKKTFKETSYKERKGKNPQLAG